MRLKPSDPTSPEICPACGRVHWKKPVCLPQQIGDNTNSWFGFPLKPSPNRALQNGALTRRVQAAMGPGAPPAPAPAAPAAPAPEPAASLAQAVLRYPLGFLTCSCFSSENHLLVRLGNENWNGPEKQQPRVGFLYGNPQVPC